MQVKFNKILQLLIAIPLASCSEFLVQEPSDQVSINEQFSTPTGVDQAVNGMYKSLETLISGKYFFYADLVGGNLSFTPSRIDYVLEVPPAIGIDQIYEFRDLEAESEYSNVYEAAYSLINEANLIIERTADLNFLSQDKRNQIRAEALAAKVLAHYVVSLLYAQNINFTPDGSHPGVVYNNRTLIAGVDYPSRKTMAETWTLMQEDLDEALSLFTPVQAMEYGPDYSYFNAITTRAMYARIALQMNSWQKALEYSDLVIRNSGVQLMDSLTYTPEWEKPEAPVSEIILEFSAPRTSDDGTVSSSVAMEYYGYETKTNYNEFVASGDLLELYDSSDIRRSAFRIEMLPTLVNDSISELPYYFTKKFQDDPGTTFIRLSEMYLIRAEAYARIGSNDILALADLNTIRTRAGLPEITSTDKLLEEIFLERRRELAFEGLLFFDIARFKKDVVRNKGCISSVCNLEYPSDYYVLPIPESSTTLNENMNQNEGY